ncbi:MAG: hypothetical protein ACR2LF_12930 [Jatrophihabitantaceae bacterium]
MISGAAFCPHPPLLVPAVGTGAAAELDALRAACRDALGKVAADGAALALLGAGPVSQAFSPSAWGSLAGFGVAADVALGAAGRGGPQLPLSLTVGAWLVADTLGPDSGALGFSVGAGFASSAAAREVNALVASRDVVLLVLADGSARRSVTAPGYLDERAAGFDDAVAAALRSGDGTALTALDAALGAELLAGGVAAWQAAGALLAGTAYDADLCYAHAPYGVGYLVATWSASA